MRKPALLILLLVCGCPYASPVPLGPAAGAPFDVGLVGRWQYRKKKEAADLLVLRFNASEYFIELRDVKKEKTTRFRGFLTRVGGRRFLNVQPIDKLDEDERSFFFVACSPEKGAWDLRIVEDKLLEGKYDQPEAMRAALKKHLEDPTLFDKDSLRFKRLPDTKK